MFGDLGMRLLAVEEFRKGKDAFEFAESQEPRTT